MPRSLGSTRCGERATMQESRCPLLSRSSSDLYTVLHQRRNTRTVTTSCDTQGWKIIVTGVLFFSRSRLHESYCLVERVRIAEQDLTAACAKKYQRNPLHPEYPAIPRMQPMINAANVRLHAPRTDCHRTQGHKAYTNHSQKGYK